MHAHLLIGLCIAYINVPIPLWLWNLICFWCCGLVAALIDGKHIDSPARRIDLLSSAYRQAIPVVLRNQLFVHTPLLIVYSYTAPQDSSSLLVRVILQGFFSTLGWTVLHYFYHSNKHIYRLIHRTHHTFSAPIGIAGEYGSLIETTINYLWIYGTALMIGKFTVSEMCGLLLAHNAQLIRTHSGLSGDRETEMHDMHHLNAKVNLSPWEWIDKILGTWCSNIK